MFAFPRRALLVSILGGSLFGLLGPGAVRAQDNGTWTWPDYDGVGEPIADTDWLFNLENNSEVGGVAQFQISDPDHNGTALKSLHLGLGHAGFFLISNSSSGGAAVLGRTTGTGMGLYGESSGTAISVYGKNTGTGQAGYFEINNTGSTANALYATSNGSGATVYGTNTGTGGAGYFSLASGSAADALYATTAGTGRALYVKHTGIAEAHAGHFEITHSTNSKSAVYATTNGDGYAVEGFVDNASGRPAYFQVNNSSNSNYAVHATTSGDGSAGYFKITKGTSGATALVADTDGSGSAIAASTNSTGAAISTSTSSSGHAVLSSTSGIGNALYASTSWSGTAVLLETVNNSVGNALHVKSTGDWGQPAVFEITDIDNNNDVVLIQNHSNLGDGLVIEIDGSGDGIQVDVQNGQAVDATATGEGTAGEFSITGSSSEGDALVADTRGVGHAGVFKIISNTTTTESALYCSTSGLGPALEVDGKASVKVLEITGADLAEKFPTSHDVQAGMIVAIDAEHPGQLCLATGEYNKRVAGIVSGANDLPAGAILGNLTGETDGVAVALTGRVWVHADAGPSAIEPGDMLTTSLIAGHAMKVQDHARAQGAIIGKAMTALKLGETGMVLVLVNLQ